MHSGKRSLTLLGMSRFPGGTPADYWLWEQGWVNMTDDCGGCSALPRRPLSVVDLKNYLVRQG